MASGWSDPRRDEMASDSVALTLAATALRVWSEFAKEPRPAHSHADPQDAEVDATLEEFGGDLRATIRALLRDIAVLAGDFEAQVSRGYVRSGVPRGERRVAPTKRPQGVGHDRQRD